MSTKTRNESLFPTSFLFLQFPTIFVFALSNQDFCLSLTVNLAKGKQLFRSTLFRRYQTVQNRAKLGHCINILIVSLYYYKIFHPVSGTGIGTLDLMNKSLVP